MPVAFPITEAQDERERKFMKQITITRDVNGNVTFKTVSIDPTENVFFTNLDPQEAHWPYLNPAAPSPDFCDNQLGPAPSPNSSQCNVPPPTSLTPPQNQVVYKCKFHAQEQGIINVFAQLAAIHTTLKPATINQPIDDQQVVQGGQSPYAISDAQFQVTSSNNVQTGAGIGPDLQLRADQINSGGITLSGIPRLAGTYNFTFTVNDKMGQNLQQVQYSMKVSDGS
jgi:hypothetical protein